MRTSDIAIRNPVFAWMLMAALIVFGAVGFSRMGVSQLPDVDFPVITVMITENGAAPEVMETTVADPLEDQLMSIEGLRTLTTVSTVGTMTATVEFELTRNVDAALQDVQTRVMAAQKSFPDTVDAPTITKTNPDDQPILWLALTGSKDTSLRELVTYARDTLKDRFTTLSGVGNVLLGGYIEPAMRVWLDPHKMAQRNISVVDVATALKEENIELPGGNFSTEGKNLNLRTLGEGKTPEDFGNIVLNRRAGQVNQDPTHIVQLKDVAKIEPGLQDLTRTSNFNGEQAIGVGIVKQKGSNAVAIGNLVRERLAELQKTLPPQFKLHLNFDTTKFIDNSVHELTSNLILSAILTALCCWLFLGSLSATFNVILSIPTSIMGAFIVLYFMGFTLNTFTLLGLSLAIGIVVDDSIMVLENIFRHHEEGKPRMESAIIGAREISFAALAATLAIVAIFLPVAFMKGVIGKFFFQFGVTITVTVMLSLLEALTITPMRLSRYGGAAKMRTDFIGRNVDAVMEKCRIWYTRVLEVCLEHPWKVVFVSIIIMLASFTTAKFLPKEFSPAQDQSVFLVRLKTSIDSSIHRTEDLMKKAEVYLKGAPEIKQYYIAVGGFGGSAFNTAMMFITMKDYRDRPVNPEAKHRLSQQEYMRVLRQELLKVDPSLEVFVQDLSMRGFTSSRGFPIEFTVRGPDWNELWKQTSAIMNGLKSSGLATDVDTDYLLGKPEVDFTPDRTKAGYHGVSVQDVGQTIAGMIGGVRTSQYTENGHRYYVMLQVEPQYQNMDILRSLLVNNLANNLVRVDQVTEEKIVPAMQSITRIDRQRAISVFANPGPGHSQQEALSFVQQYESQLPQGYRIVLSGSSQTFKESFDSLIFALVLGLFVAYMVLASQFNSFIDPISVLVALPFSVSGAFVALLITHQSLNIYSMIGLILLMGIVKKNSILLVDFTNAARDRGEPDVKKALIQACPVRLRPILMTSIACIAAAIPEAVSFGAGSETTIPMAVSIIGGVMVSTFLTLLVVPCVYQLFSRIQKRAQNKDEIRNAFIAAGETGIDPESDFLKEQEIRHHRPTQPVMDV